LESLDDLDDRRQATLLELFAFATQITMVVFSVSRSFYNIVDGPCNAKLLLVGKVTLSFSWQLR
jgi:hypothetical protein